MLIQDESYQSHMAFFNKFETEQSKVCHIKQQLKNIPPRLQPLTLLQRFYLDIPEIAAAHGVDPDNPPGLQKITKTV